MNGRLKNMDKFRNAWFLLEKLMDSTLDSIYFKDLQSRFMMLNKACATKLGWDSPEEGVGKSDFDIFTGVHAKQAYAEGRALKDVAKEQTGLSAEELAKLLDPAQMTKGGIMGE